MYPLYNHFPISIYPLCNQILCPAKARWRDGVKNAVSAEQDSPRQPEIAPQFCRREILVGNPLPTPSETCLQPVGSLRSQHDVAMNVTAAENNEKKFYKFVCNGRAKEIIKVPAKRMAERNAPDKRDRVWRSLSETVGDFPRSFYP